MRLTAKVTILIAGMLMAGATTLADPGEHLFEAGFVPVTDEMETMSALAPDRWLPASSDGVLCVSTDPEAFCPEDGDSLLDLDPLERDYEPDQALLSFYRFDEESIAEMRAEGIGPDELAAIFPLLMSDHGRQAYSVTGPLTHGNGTYSLTVYRSEDSLQTYVIGQLKPRGAELVMVLAAFHASYMEYEAWTIATIGSFEIVDDEGEAECVCE